MKTDRVTLARNALALFGVALIVAGVGIWSSAAACITAGAIVLAFVYVTTK